MRLNSPNLTATWLVLQVCFVSGSASAEAPSSDKNSQLAGTIRRYFSSFADYQEGNLICKSQVDELQRFLRRTRGNIPASHKRLLHRVLADEAPLSRLFYSQQGEQVLKAAATKLSGYAKLELSARSALGRRLIMEAIESKQIETLVEYAKREFDDKPSVQGKQLSHPASNVASSRIYTVDQFIRATVTAPNEDQASDSKQSPPDRAS